MKSKRIQLNELGILRQGLTLSRYLDPHGPKKRVLQIANLSAGLVEMHPEDRFEQIDERRAHDFFARPGQLLVSLRGNALKAAVVPAGLRDGVVSSSLISMELLENCIDAHFLAGLLNSQAMQRQIQPLLSGASIQGIPLARFKELQIELPPLEQQKKIARALEVLYRYEKEMMQIVSLRHEEMEVYLNDFIVKERV